MLSARELREAKEALGKAIDSGRVHFPEPRSPQASDLMARRAERLQNGRCKNCGRPQASDSRTLCQQCREYQRACDNKRAARFAAAGLCTLCGAPRDRINQRTGKPARQCTKCRTRDERYARFAAAGLCTQCGAPRDRLDKRTGQIARQCAKCRARTK